MFIDRHDQANVIEDHMNFFKRLKELKLYIIEFEKDSIIKPKIYLTNCVVGKDE